MRHLWWKCAQAHTGIHREKNTSRVRAFKQFGIRDYEVVESGGNSGGKVVEKKKPNACQSAGLLGFG